jgi:MFS family permease
MRPADRLSPTALRQAGLVVRCRRAPLWSGHPRTDVPLRPAVFSLGLGFVSNNNTFIVLRALQGIGAGMTIPAALRMIVIFFPPEQRPIAIAVFGASG